MIYNNDNIKKLLRTNKITAKLIENFIKYKLRSDDAWMYKALTRLFEYQTSEEQQNDETFESNSVGFSGVDAELLSSYAKQYIDRKFLTPKQKLWCRNKITKYWTQLWNISDQHKVINLINEWRSNGLDY